MEGNDELITTVAEQQMQIADLTLKLEFVDAERTDLLRRCRVINIKACFSVSL